MAARRPSRRSLHALVLVAVGLAGCATGPSPMAEGVAHLEAGRYEQAVEALSRALDADRDDEAAYLRRGDAYAGIGRSDLALADYDRAVEIAIEKHRLTAIYFSRRGAAHFRAHNYERAMADWEQAKALAALPATPAAADGAPAAPPPSTVAAPAAAPAHASPGGVPGAAAAGGPRPAGRAMDLSGTWVRQADSAVFSLVDDGRTVEGEIAGNEVFEYYRVALRWETETALSGTASFKERVTPARFAATVAWKVEVGGPATLRVSAEEPGWDERGREVDRSVLGHVLVRR